MRCPVDNETLVMADRSGVEIDYCPKCRGVWLDRGELDKIIEKSTPAPQAAAPQPVHLQQPRAAPDAHDRGRDRRNDDDDNYRGGNRDGHRRKTRESFLGELFDF